jgi:hypothetical protein
MSNVARSCRASITTPPTVKLSDHRSSALNSEAKPEENQRWHKPVDDASPPARAQQHSHRGEQGGGMEHPGRLFDEAFLRTERHTCLGDQRGKRQHTQHPQAPEDEEGRQQAPGCPPCKGPGYGPGACGSLQGAHFYGASALPVGEVTG